MRKKVVAIRYNGRNMSAIKQMVKEHSLPSNICSDYNDLDKEFLLSAVSHGDAIEEYPEVGDLYVIDLATKEIWLYTENEYNAEFIDCQE